MPGGRALDPGHAAVGPAAEPAPDRRVTHDNSNKRMTVTLLLRIHTSIAAFDTPPES